MESNTLPKPKKPAKMIANVASFLILEYFLMMLNKIIATIPEIKAPINNISNRLEPKTRNEMTIHGNAA